MNRFAFHSKLAISKVLSVYSESEQMSKYVEDNESQVSHF